MCLSLVCFGEYSQNAALLHFCPQAGTFWRDRHK